MSLMSFKSFPEQGHGEYLALAREALSRLPGPPPRSELGPSPDSAAVARLLRMPLDRFEQEGRPLEVRVPWLRVTLWFVPREADAEALEWEGITRGRIWTAAELEDLMAIPGLTQEQAQTVARIKAAFDGEVVEVRLPGCRPTATDPEHRAEWTP